MHEFRLKPEDNADGGEAVRALADTLREIGRTAERARTLTRLADEARPDRAPVLRAQSDEHVGDVVQLVDQARGLVEAIGRALRTAEGLATLRTVATADESGVRSW